MTIAPAALDRWMNEDNKTLVAAAVCEAADEVFAALQADAVAVPLQPTPADRLSTDRRWARLRRTNRRAELAADEAQAQIDEALTEMSLR